MNDFPNLDDGYRERKEAGSAVMKRTVEAVLAGAAYMPPEPFDDLREFWDHVKWLQTARWWTPRQKQMLRWFLRDIDALLTKMAAPT